MKRVDIIQRDDSAFTFEEWYFSDDPLEMAWFPISEGRSMALCDSFDTALREAYGRIKWLADERA